MSTLLDNIQAAHKTLKGCVISALHTQLSDVVRLGDTQTEVLLLLQAAEQVSVFHFLVFFRQCLEAFDLYVTLAHMSLDSP